MPAGGSPRAQEGADAAQEGADATPNTGQSRRFSRDALSKSFRDAGLLVVLDEDKAPKEALFDSPRFLLRRFFYLLDAQLEFLSVQLAILLLFAALLAVSYGKLIQWSRNWEWTGSPGSTQIEKETGYADGVWFAVTLISNPSMGNWPDRPIEQWNRLVCMTLAGIGILYLAVVVAVVVQTVVSKMKYLKKGLSQVVERDHTVILGWDDKVFAIVRELLLVNAENGGGTIVVLCGELDKEEADRELKKRFSRRARGRTEIVVRRGSSLHESALLLVSVQTAKSIILISNKRLTPELADAEILQSIISIQSVINPSIGDGAQRRLDQLHLVVEVMESDSEPQLNIVGGGEGNMFTAMVTSAIIGRLLLIFVRKPGLARAYDELLGFRGNKFYVQRCEQLTGIRWRDVGLHFPDAVPFGIRSGHAIKLNPKPETIFRRRDEIVLLASSPAATRWTHAHNLPPLRRLAASPPAPGQSENVLFAGCVLPLPLSLCARGRRGQRARPSQVMNKLDDESDAPDGPFIRPAHSS